MLYPIMPIYLKSIGFSIVLGILEGVAEATAGLSKAISENVRCDWKEFRLSNRLYI
jgi:hypothetical protein